MRKNEKVRQDNRDEIDYNVTEEDAKRTIGKAHWIGHKKPEPMKSPMGFQLFLLALPVGLIVLCFALLLLLFPR